MSEAAEGADLPVARTTPADLARWLFWVPFRGALDPARPGPIRHLHAAWRAQYLAAGSGRALMADEYERCFGDAYDARDYELMVASAYRSAWRVHLEELLLGKLGPDTIDEFIRFEGWEHLEAARAAGKGVLWLYPHAGAVMLMMAGLVYRGMPYTQYAARGLPPPEVARDHPQLLASNRWREAVRRVREENEDRLPAQFVTLDRTARVLYRRLAANELVGIAYDGRIGTRWRPVPYLGRRALLSPGPYRLACSTGATVIPAFCHTPVDGPAVCEIGAPVEPGKDWRALMTTVLAAQERFIRRWPEEYGIWLLHARQRNHIDDHPLFIDHAADERWRRWEA